MSRISKSGEPSVRKTASPLELIASILETQHAVLLCLAGPLDGDDVDPDISDLNNVVRSELDRLRVAAKLPPFSRSDKS